MTKNKQESRLRELIAAAQRNDIEVRSEKLLREVGYRVRSGLCRVRGKTMVFLDRDTSLSEQVEFLKTVLAEDTPETR